MRKASLYIYVRTAKGWRYMKPARGSNNKVIPQTVVIDGQREHHPEGKYYAAVDGKWIPMGDNATAAVAQCNLMSANLTAAQRAAPPPAKASAATTEKPLPVKDKLVLVADAQQKYLDYIDTQIRIGRLKKLTWVNARSITDEFLKWLGENTSHTTIKQITAADVNAYIAWTIERSPTKSHRTAQNKHARVSQFLKFCGHTCTSSKDAPRCPKNTPVRVYTAEELETFFKACTPLQALTFRTLLKTGLRKQELEYLERTDIDAANGCLHIREKRHYGFSPKTWEARMVWIDDELLADLTEHLKTHKHALVFPREGSSGEPNHKLLSHLKRIVKRAGLNPDDYWLHAFRSSYATGLLRAGLGIAEVQRLLGHAHGSQSIWRYVRAIEGEQLRDKLNDIYKRKTVADA